jgi:hypothetical protein
MLFWQPRDSLLGVQGHTPGILGNPLRWRLCHSPTPVLLPTSRCWWHYVPWALSHNASHQVHQNRSLWLEHRKCSGSPCWTGILAWCHPLGWSNGSKSLQVSVAQARLPDCVKEWAHSPSVGAWGHIQPPQTVQAELVQAVMAWGLNWG